MAAQSKQEESKGFSHIDIETSLLPQTHESQSTDLIAPYSIYCLLL